MECEDPEEFLVLEASEGIWCVVVDDGKHYAVENAVDAEMGGGEGIVATDCHNEAEHDDRSRGCGEKEEQVAHPGATAGGDGETEDEEQVGVLFDGQAPGMGYTA